MTGLEIKLHRPNLEDGRQLAGWQLLLSPLLVLLYAVPGFLVGAGVTGLIKHGLTAAHHHIVLAGGANAGHSAWSHIQTLWTKNKDQKLIGFFASVFLGRPPVRAVAEDLQAYFVARTVALGRPPRFYHLLNFQARMNAATAEGAAMRIDKTANWVPYLMSFAIAIGVVLAGFGYWVLPTKREKSDHLPISSFVTPAAFESTRQDGDRVADRVMSPAALLRLRWL